MKLFQPYPDHSSPIHIEQDNRPVSRENLRFIRYRVQHHAAASGYDRLCDFFNSPTIYPSKSLYWLGETILRLPAIALAKLGGHYEYSRYDAVMEMAAILEFMKNEALLFHFIYGEKSFHLMKYLAGKRNHKIVLTVHHPPEHFDWLFNDYSHFEKVDHLITMDERSLPFWKSAVGPDRVSWIPHGIDVHYFKPASDKKGGRFVALFAGTHERDLEALSTVMALSSQEQLEVEFRLVGGSPKLHQLAEYHNNASALGFLSDAAYLKELQNADVLLLPLKTSTVCNAVLESLACGTPVITTSGGIEAYLNDSCSKVVTQSNPNEMFEALKVQAMGPDRDKLSRDMARKTAAQFSWENVARAHEEIYQHLNG